MHRTRARAIGRLVLNAPASHLNMRDEPRSPLLIVFNQNDKRQLF